MDKRNTLLLCMTFVLAPWNLSYAQDLDIEEVVITGSYLKSNPGDEALPVQVLERDYIDGIGANSLSDVISKLSISSGAENQADSFTQGSTQGTANVNLRGLGLSSTLVLINGRRQTISGALANDGSVFVDTSSIPIEALQRVEVLKEGATSTYGSDAIAGVVNFVLREEFNGFDLSVRHQKVDDGGQTDNSIGFIWGNGNGTTHLTIAGNYLDRSALSATKRPNLADNANSSLGSSFISYGAATVESGVYAGTYEPGQYIPNAECESYSEGRPIGNILCGFAYGPRFNLVNAEKRIQLYSNLHHDFENGVELLGEIGLSNNEVSDNPQSPSYPDLTFPVISASHPSNPLGVPLAWLGRPFAFGYPSPLAPRENDTFRASISLTGSLQNGWNWNTALTHSSNEYRAIQPDTIASRLRDAFVGQGGPNGDEYYDPFIPENNSQALYDFMSYQTDSTRTTDLTVLDGVMSGDLILLSSGKTIEMAIGVQLINEGYKTETDDLYEIKYDENGIAIPVDLIFLGGISELDESRNGYSAFIEAKAPISDTFELTGALRYEDLEFGTSIDPKIALRWQASDMLVLRASASTAFRQPSLSQVNAQIVQLINIQDYNIDGTAKGGSAFVRVTQSGSSELEGEESDNLNFGLIFKPYENLDLKLDYWNVNYTDLITVENPQGKLLADLNGPDVVRTDTGALSGIIVDYFNSSDVDVTGLDLEMYWEFRDSWVLSLNAAQMLEYDITLPTGDKVDALGSFNSDNFARSLPKTKANVNLTWSDEAQSATLNMNHVSNYKNGLDKVNSFDTIDVQYAIVFNTDDDTDTIKASFGIKNLLDEAPPRVIDGANFSYDSKQHSPLGRTLYMSLRFQY